MRRPMGGFSMVEVLVAVLLLAVGLVGALAMQAHAMRTRQASAWQTEALQAAADLADHIRANATQSSAYLGFELDGADGLPAAPAAPGACVDTPCDAAALARRELAEFAQHLLTVLPSGRAVICRDSPKQPGGQPQWECTHSPDAPITIKIGWRSREQNPSPAPQLALTVILSPSTPTPPTAPPPSALPISPLEPSAAAPEPPSTPPAAAPEPHPAAPEPPAAAPEPPAAVPEPPTAAPEPSAAAPEPPGDMCQPPAASFEPSAVPPAARRSGGMP